MKFSCFWYGHSLGEVRNVITNSGSYRARTCSKCGERFPESEDDQAAYGAQRRLEKDLKEFYRR